MDFIAWHPSKITFFQDVGLICGTQSRN